MKAMLLAAGRGDRLRPLTDNVPKPMIEIAGKPILEHNVVLLAHYGIREIMINLHHCPAAVSDYFGDGRKWGVSIRYSHEETLLGTAGAVKRVEEFFDSTWMLLYGDNLTNCNLAALLAKHRHAGAAATLALFRREDVAQSGVAVLDEADRVQEFVEKPTSVPPPSHWVSAGLMVAEKEILDLIPSGRPSDFGFDVLPDALRRGLPVFGYRMHEDLWWIDTLEYYDYVRSLANQNRIRIP
jgi:NDP-sugar pyrophosphorylase family protein